MHENGRKEVRCEEKWRKMCFHLVWVACENKEKEEKHVGPTVKTFLLCDGKKMLEIRDCDTNFLFCLLYLFFIHIRQLLKLSFVYIQSHFLIFFSLLFSIKQQEIKYTFLFIFSFHHFLSSYFLFSFERNIKVQMKGKTRLVKASFQAH